MKPKTVSLILARGGNEKQSIPFKNLTMIHGRPLLSYVIEQSVVAQNIQETWVSSNCEKTLEVAKHWGARTIERPEEISGPDSHNEWAMMHFAKEQEFDNIICIQPTSPLATAYYYDEAISIINENQEIDSIFSANESKWTPHWERVPSPDNTSELIPLDWDPEFRPMRQDVSFAIEENGAFYITRKKALMKSKKRYSGNIKSYMMPRSRSVQVDDQEDLAIVSALLYQDLGMKPHQEQNPDFEDFMTPALEAELRSLDKPSLK